MKFESFQNGCQKQINNRQHNKNKLVKNNFLYFSLINARSSLGCQYNPTFIESDIEFGVYLTSLPHTTCGIVVVWRLYYVDTLKRELIGSYA